MNYLADILWVAGTASITVGAALLNPAAGCIVGGVLLIVSAVLVAMTRRDVKSKTDVA